MTAKDNDRSKMIFFVQGGAGDVLSHTPMIRYFRKKFPDDELIVLSTYSQLLEHNPNIDTLIHLRSPKDFYSEHIHKKNVRFFKKHFIYDGIMDRQAKGCVYLPEFICKMYDAEYDGKPLDYFVTDYEKRSADVFIGQYKQFGVPIVLLHCTGAIPSDGNFNKTNNLKDLNIATATKVVESFKEKVIFIQIGLAGEQRVEGSIDALGMTMRETIALIPAVDSYVFIESLFAHCSNALGGKGVVVCQNMDPEFFGHPNNNNISWSGGCEDWPCNRPVGALLDLSPGFKNPKTREQFLWECNNQVCAGMPYEHIAESLHAILEEKHGKGNIDLEKARRISSPKFATVESPSQGKVTATDPSLPSDAELQEIQDDKQSESEDADETEV